MSSKEHKQTPLTSTTSLRVGNTVRGNTLISLSFKHYIQARKGPWYSLLYSEFVQPKSLLQKPGIYYFRERTMRILVIHAEVLLGRINLYFNITWIITPQHEEYSWYIILEMFLSFSSLWAFGMRIKTFSFGRTARETLDGMNILLEKNKGLVAKPFCL